METCDRRKFIGICLGGVAAAAAAATAFPVYRYLAPISANEAKETVVIPLADIAPGEARFIEYAGAAAVVVKTGKGDVVALSAVCTHLGCIVQWQKDKQDFICPCHGGTYALDGTVTAGPPPKPLQKLPVKIAGDTITIG